MTVDVYTIIPAPFRMGGTLEDYIYTTIEEYERVDIGSGYFGILFQNPHTNAWHMAIEDCGALIGTLKSRAKLIKQVKSDVASGTPEILEQQLKMGKRQMNQAEFMDRIEWFSRFRKTDD
jgi:hypothetical protein